MTPNQVLILYFAFFAAEFIFENILTVLNRREIKAHAGSIPPEFAAYIDPEDHSKAVAYSVAKSNTSIVSQTVSSFILAAVILTGFLGMVEAWIMPSTGSVVWRGVVYVVAMSVFFRITSLPMSLYVTFGLEKKFGFNTTTIGTFIVDMAKGLVISALIGIPILAALFWFMDSLGSIWWIVAFGFIAAVQLIMRVVYPVVIAPLFNKFSPLEDGPLKVRLEGLAEKLSFKTSGIYVMDGSKRSKHSNAYFTGIGKAKRIVLFDTLISGLSEEQLTAVLSHEIGHEKKRHIAKYTVVSLGIMLAGLFVVDLLLGSEVLFRAFGFANPSYHGILVILSFCAGPFTFMLNPLMTSWSRKHEYEADRFAVDAMDGSDELVTGLVELSKDNLSNLTPHRWYSFYHYTHPTLSERISAAKEYALNHVGPESE